MRSVCRNVKKTDISQWKNVRNKSGKPDYFFIKDNYTQTDCVIRISEYKCSNLILLILYSEPSCW